MHEQAAMEEHFKFVHNQQEFNQELLDRIALIMTRLDRMKGDIKELRDRVFEGEIH